MYLELERRRDAYVRALNGEGDGLPGPGGGEAPDRSPDASGDEEDNPAWLLLGARPGESKESDRAGDEGREDVERKVPPGGWERQESSYERRREFTCNEWSASCRADGCVDLNDPYGGDLHICNFEEFIAMMIDLNEATIASFKGVPFETNWETTEEITAWRKREEQFKADLLLRYPDTYARMYGNR
jgi:hypothetical protein